MPQSGATLGVERAAERRTVRSAVLAVLACLALAASSIATLSVSATPAAAATVGFTAGNIIDDPLFYDGDGMSSTQIQAFLNRMVPDCEIGDPGKEAGKKWGSTSIAKKCLRSYSQKTSSKAADENCKAYAGRSSESAAQIIYRVGQACNINPKVLLITLQKEQSLVSDTWPTVMQYNRATGYGCPDSGPNNSANCDSKYYGFFNQVYLAAWQFQHYKNASGYFNFKKGQTVAVGYHPNNSCGGSTITIKGWATAGLYNYTPYQPNAAALAAGWGTGNSCSSYGNRNFYNYWKSWFGSVRAADQMTKGMQAAYDRALDDGIDLGAPTSTRKTITANGGGYQMTFENGLITQSTKLGKTYAVHAGGWSSTYLAAGGAAGSWGFLAGTQSAMINGYKTLKFQNGRALWTKDVGVQYMPTMIYTAWAASGASYGPLGFPAKKAATPTSSSASQTFTKATVMVTGSGSTSTIVTPAELARWTSAGGYADLGFFTADASTDGDRGFRPTEKGRMFFTSATTQVFIEKAPFLSGYLASGGPSGAWGWPVSARKMHKGPGGGSQIGFENGIAVHTPATGVAFLSPASYDDWKAMGGSAAPLGYPDADTSVLADGFVQHYAGTMRFAGPGSTVDIRGGKLLTGYLKAGGPSGAWGWPVGPQVDHAGASGSEIAFDHGVEVYSPATGAAFMTPAAHADWLSRGGPSGVYGYPTASTTVVADGSYQRYATRIVFTGPDVTRVLRVGAITEKYLSGGTQNPKWGWPIGAKVDLAQGADSVVFSTGVAVTSKLATVFMTQKAYNSWITRGGPSGSLGFPYKNTAVLPDGSYQRYLKYMVFYGPTKVVTLKVGPAKTAYFAAGGPSGKWGWPIGLEKRKSDGSSTIPFQHGTAHISKTGKVAFTSK